MRHRQRQSAATAASPSALQLVLDQEHARHANRLAEIRRINVKLDTLGDVLSALAAQRIHIALDEIRAYRRIIDKPEAITLRTGLFGDGHTAAVATTLLGLGFKVEWAHSDTASVRLNCEAIFRRGHTCLHVYVSPASLTEACERGDITARTEGTHPANDTGRPLAAAAAPAWAAEA